MILMFLAALMQSGVCIFALLDPDVQPWIKMFAGAGFGACWTFLYAAWSVQNL